MTDIVEQAARVACPNGPDHDHQPNLDQGCNWALQLCQALADAGLLHEPARTVPTREQIVDVLVMSPLADTAGTDLAPFNRAADAVLALMADQPTVAEAKAEAWEEGARAAWRRTGAGRHGGAAEGTP